MARATPFLGHEGPGAQLLRLGDVPLIHAADDARFALLGGTFVGEGALLRFYVLHCVALPLAHRRADGRALLARAQGWRHLGTAQGNLMGFIKGIFNAVANPWLFFTLAVASLAILVWKRERVASNTVGYGLLGILTVFLVFGTFDANFRLIVTKPDNVPILVPLTSGAIHRQDAGCC